MLSARGGIVADSSCDDFIVVFGAVSRPTNYRAAGVVAEHTTQARRIQHPLCGDQEAAAYCSELNQFLRASALTGTNMALIQTTQNAKRGFASEFRIDTSSNANC